MEAWIDDSGTDLAGPIFTYAGFLSTADRWNKFSDEWKETLKAPPSIDYFKMHEAAHSCGQFQNWTEGPTNRKIEQLVKVICKHAEASLLVTMNLRDYQNVIHKRKRVPHPIDFPQFLSFHGLIAGTLRFFKKNTDFFFDNDPVHEHRIFEYWEVLKQVVPPDIAEFLQPQPLFRDDKKFVPLQAADLLAWNIRKMASGESASRQWIVEGLSVVPSFTLELDSKKLSNFAKESPRIFNRETWEQFDGGDEFEAFDKTMHSLIKVSHSDIKSRIDAEKVAKGKKRKVKKPSASGRAAGASYRDSSY